MAAGPGSWQVQPKNDALSSQGYVAPNGVSLTVSSGAAYPVNFVASRPSSFLAGNATENGNPLVGAVLDAQPQNGGSNIQATTGATGNFSLGVSAGTWNVSLDSSTAQQANLVGPQLTETVSDNQTISGLAYPVVPATATVNGTVRDANHIPLSSSYNVDATASINGLQYNVDSNLDGGGGYRLPLINGNWSINVYGPNGSPPGFVQTSLSVTGNQTFDLAPLQATAHFSGTVTQNGSALAGVTMDAQPQNSGNIQFQATTDSGGNFTLGVVAGTWNIFMDGSSVAANNLVVPQLTETISDNQTISNLAYPVVPATATISGTAKDANGVPLTPPYNVNASATINSLQYNVSSNLDSSGNYSLPLINGSWNINVYGPNGGPPGFQVVALNVTGNQTLNLAPLQATAHFSGTVTENGTVLTGVTMDAQLQNSGGNTQVQGTTDSGGNFTIGVVAGTWNIYLDGSSANANNLVVPMLNETISNNQTISGLSYPVLAATATVSGTVKDANGHPLSSSYYVDASATINGLPYHASVNLDNNGNYSLPLVNGSWNINVYGPGGQPPGFQQTTVNVTGNQTINLAPNQDTTPPTLVSSFPATGVTGVPPNSTVAFTFDEPMRSGYSINWTPNVNAGQFNYTWSQDQRTLTCTYNTGLPTGVTIGWVLNPSSAGQNFQDTAGNPLASDISGNFTTAQGNGGTQTIQLRSDPATLAAVDSDVNALDTGNTTGLVFQATDVGAAGTNTPIPSAAPAGTVVINIPPSDGESGFFKVNFSLPAGATGIQLSGAANVDDLGRVFLNGHALTASLNTTSGGRVQEFGDQGFTTSDPSLFQTGNNELVIADWNSGGGPSGASFYANVTFSQSSNSPAVTFYTVSKWETYLQSSAATPVSAIVLNDPNGDFDFEASVSGGNLSVLSPAPSVTLPGGATETLVYTGGQWHFNGSAPAPHNFTSQAALDAAFPDGNYTLHVGSLAGNVTFALAPDSYPNTPMIVNGTWDAQGNLTVSATANATVSFNTFTNYAAGGAVSFSIYEIGSDGQGHPLVGSQLVNAFNLSTQSDPLLTSYTIPAGTLQPNQLYYAEVNFTRILNPNTSTIPGALGGAIFERHTAFYLSTAQAGAPGIASQPVSETVTLGQGVTFSVSGNGTGPLSYQWLKDGVPLNGANSANLTLSNVQLTDAGYYSAVVESGSGNTTSAEAALTLPSFPIANTAQAEISVSGAFDGTNFLVGIQGDATAHYDVTAQLVSPTGALVGPRISTGRTGGAPWVAFDGTNYLMVWEDDALYPVNRLYGAFISPAGNLVGSPFAFPVRSGASSRQAPQGIAFDGTNYLVLYSDDHDSSWPDLGGDYYNSANLCGRFVTPAGTVGDEFVVAANAEGTLQGLAWNGSAFLAAWPAHTGGNQNIVQGRTISATGVMSSPFTIDASVSIDQNPLSVATDGTNFLVAWNYDANVDGSGNPIWELRGRVVTPAGGFGGPVFTIADTTTRPFFPAVAYDGSNYFVAWTAFHGPTNLDLVGEYVSPAGSPQGDVLGLALGAGNQGLPVLVFGSGGNLVAWTDSFSLANGFTGGDVRGLFLSGPPVVTHFIVNKWETYLQNSAAAPVSAIIPNDPNGSFNFSSSVEGTNLAGLSPAPSVALPDGTTYSLVFNNSKWSFDKVVGAPPADFTSQAALDAAFPDGNYTMGVGSLAGNVTIGLTPDSYPNTPVITGGTWDAQGNLSVNATVDTTIGFNTFANYANQGAIGFSIYSVGTDGQGHINVAQQLVNTFSLSIQSDPLVTSYTVPAGTLQANQVYFAELDFIQIVNLNTTAIPGAFGAGVFERHTGFYISTAPVAAPAILTSPANQTVMAGQNATFSVTASGNPPPSFQWQLSSDNGTTWGNLTDGGAYSGSLSANLTVLAASTSLNGDQYRGLASNGLGSAPSTAATLTVNPAPAAVPAPQLAAMQFFGGAGDQRGTGIAVANGTVYVTGNAQPESQTSSDYALVAAYPIPFGAPPAWSRTFTNGSMIFGAAADGEGVYGVGSSYSLTSDPVGGKEVKPIVAKFAIDGSNGSGPSGSLWVAGSGGTAGLGAFFAYSGVEMFHAATTNLEGGVPVVYAVGAGQPASYGAYLVAKFDAAGNRLAAATDSSVGVSLGSVSIPSTGGSSANGVAVLGGSIYVAGSTGWAFEDAAGRPALWIYNSSLNLSSRQRDTSLAGNFNAVASVGGAIYAAGSAVTPGVSGSDRYLVQKFDASGNRQWSVTWGGSGTDVLTGVVGVGSRLFVCGYTNSQGAGGYDGVLCELDPATGSLLSTVYIGGTQDDRANGLATDGNDLYVVGESRSATTGANGQGQNDGFVARYVIGPPALVSIAVTPAGPTVAIGATQQFTATGNFTDGTSRPLTSGGNTWTSGPSIPTVSYGLRGEFVGGKFYAISGFATTRVAVYDPVANSWTTVASLPQLLQYFGSAVVNGKIYVMGGDTGGSGDRATLYCYDPSSDTWTTLPSMPLGPRYGVRAAVLGGKIYAIGGTSIETGTYLDRVEIYDPVANSWSTGTPLPSARLEVAAGVIQGKLYIAGGNDGTGLLTSAYVLDPVANTWNAIAPLGFGQNGSAVVVDNKLFIIGGGGAGEAGVQAYDPVSNTWTSLAPLPTGRHDLGAAVDVVNRQIYTVGGWNGNYVSALQIFTPPGEATWSTSNPGVASLTAGGLAAGLAGGTSTISATVGGVTGSTQLSVQNSFSAYQRQYFNLSQQGNPAISGPNANPAHDGLNNLLKYAFGLDPTRVDAAAGLPVVSRTGGSLTLSFIRRHDVTDLTYTVEVSSDLQTWTSGSGATQQVSVTALDAQRDQVVVRDLTPLSGTTRRFIRLRVTQQ